MSLSLPVLDSITIASPCSVPWDEMQGDDRTRFCNKCSQNVHDVSELTQAEAVQLLAGDGKPPCLRIYRRPDGRVMTADCATRRERVWKWLHKRSALAAGIFALIFFAGCGKSPPDCIAGEPFVERPEVKPPEKVAEEAARAVVAAITTAGKSDRGR